MKCKGSLQLTKKLDYGILLLSELVHNGESKSIKTIALENDLSFAFLQKIAQSLQQKGIISANRGKYGGYNLNKKPEEISIGEIMEILEGPINVAPCVHSNCKALNTCKIRHGLEEMNHEVKNYFQRKTLKNFI